MMGNLDYEKELITAMMHLDVAKSRNSDPDIAKIVKAGKEFIKLYMDYIDFKERDPYDFVYGAHDLCKAMEDVSKFLEKPKK